MTDFDYSRTINGDNTFRVQQSVNPTVPKFGPNMSQYAAGAFGSSYGGVSGSSGTIGGVSGPGAAQATTRDVGRNELVQNQLVGLLNQSNPYIARARRAAMDQSASRGLSNTSIAAGNAEGAAIDRAMPIAAQDASTYGRTASENMAALNAIEQANLQAQTALAQSRISAAASRANANASLKASILDNENALIQQERDAQIRAYDDARRQAYSIENRESGENYRFGQDLGFRQNQFYDDLGFRQNQFYDDLGFRNRQLDVNSMLTARGQDAQLLGQRAIAQSNAVGAVANNPNLEAEQQQAAMDRAARTVGDYFQQTELLLPPFIMPPLSFNLGGGFAGGYGLPTYYAGG